MIKNSTSADLYMLVPKGRKYFAWFTYLRGENVCVFMEFNGHEIMNCVLYNVCCSDDLFYGTILYGTMFKQKQKTFFSVEDIFQYQHKWVYLSPLEKKLSILKTIFQEKLTQVSYTNQCIIMGIPIISDDYSKAVDQISSLPYQIFSILHVFSKKTIRLQQRFIQQDAVFQVEADINNDIYHLYCMKNGTKEIYDTALINDYKTSVLMNQLFRNIKENQNLDTIEESDSEEEFEDTNELKYMLQAAHRMKCQYLPQFNKWTPVCVSQNTPIVTYDSLYLYKKK